jgi:sugar phosphate isomerase/epimerase
MFNGRIRSDALKTALCWGCIPSVDIHRLADIAAAYGFDEISVTAGHYWRAIALGMIDSQFTQSCAAKGIRVGVIDAPIAALPGVPGPEQVRPDWRHLFEHTIEDCFRAASSLGARTINVAHFLGSPEVSPQELASVVREIAQEAVRRGMRLSIEFIPGTGIATLASAIDLIERVGSGGVGVMFDTWHFLRSGGRVSDLGQLRAGQIFELQLSDRRAPPPNETYIPMTGRLLPGHGEAPLLTIVQSLIRRAPDLVIGLEVFNSEPALPEAIAERLAAATGLFLKSVETTSAGFSAIGAKNADEIP